MHTYEIVVIRADGSVRTYSLPPTPFDAVSKLASELLAIESVTAVAVIESATVTSREVH